MKSPLVIRIEGWISFLIPFLSCLSGGAVLSNTETGRVLAVICSALVAGLSGLKSFLSTTFSDSLPSGEPVNTTLPKL